MVPFSPQTTMAITALGDPVLALPPGLDARQLTLGRAALANIPPPPRSLPPRLVVSEALQRPFLGRFAALVPPLVQYWCRDALVGPRGIGNVIRAEVALDPRGNDRHFIRVEFEYVVDGDLHQGVARANETDGNDARNARVIPIVVDPANPRNVIVWWSALDVR